MARPTIRNRSVRRLGKMRWDRRHRKGGALTIAACTAPGADREMWRLVAGEKLHHRLRCWVEPAPVR